MDIDLQQPSVEIPSLPLMHPERQNRINNHRAREQDRNINKTEQSNRKLLTDIKIKENAFISDIRLSLG